MKKQQTQLLFVNSIFSSSLPYYFITILLLKEIGFSFSEIGYLAMITQFIGMILDLPTSLLAKWISEKKLLLVANFLMIIALLLVLKGVFWIGVIAAVLMGISESITSGISQSFTYKMFEKNAKFEKFISVSTRWQYVFTAMITLITPILLKISTSLPIVISVLFLFVSFLTLLPLQPSSTVQVEEAVKPKEAALGRETTLFIILGVLVNNMVMMANTYTSVILKEDGILMEYLGVVLFGFSLIMAIGTHIPYRKWFVVIFPILVILVGVVPNLFVVIFLLAVFRLLNSRFKNYFTTRFNSLIANNRAFAWSKYTFVLSISFIGNDFITSQIAHYQGVHMSYIVVGVIVMLLLVVYGLACFIFEKY